MRYCRLLLLSCLVCFSGGCGGFAAKRMAQAPNSYPKWLAPKAPVTLEFSDKVLTVFTNEFLQVPSPPARLRYRVVEPADYEFNWTNSVSPDDRQLTFSFKASVDRLHERANSWTAKPRGTVLLIHGYGVAGFAMLPWAFLLGQEGWRCVLVDLRGHGKSTGKRIYFGTQETRDLSALLDQLARDGRLKEPLHVLGDSLGAVVALRLKTSDPRIQRVVAISPYANLGNAILNIADQYARWLPDSFLKAGLCKLPDLLQVSPADLNPESWIGSFDTNNTPVLFVAGTRDEIAPVPEVQRLAQLAGSQSELLIVPDATHEALPFHLEHLAEPVIAWFGAD